MDIHRTLAEVVFWQDGCLRWHGRIDMTRSGLEGFGRSLAKDDEVVLEATGNAMAMVRVLIPYVARVVMANPLPVKAIAHAHVKTDNDRCRRPGVAARGRLASGLPCSPPPPAPSFPNAGGEHEILPIPEQARYGLMDRERRRR